MIDKRTIQKFQKKVYSFYESNGRHTLPWRKTKNPYRILVSEIMLQQTQVDRVIVKYQDFLKAFPTVKSLSNASLSDVLKLWSGLGYNRRARFLHQAAQYIVQKHSGNFPNTREELQQLPGVGPYTAGAIATFAFDVSLVMIETNIRSVFLHEFFNTATKVSDKDILPYIEASQDTENPARWYAALMDYGTFLKKEYPNPNRKSKHYVAQSKFKGSLRQVRGTILPLLFEKERTVAYIMKATGFEKKKIETALENLSNDGLVQKNGRGWGLTS